MNGWSVWRTFIPEEQKLLISLACDADQQAKVRASGFPGLARVVTIAQALEVLK